MATSTGKIGRLPAELRTRLNLMIRDNWPAEKMIGWLKEQGVRNISPQNISVWKNYGYREWERRQERIEEMQLRTEFARAIVERESAAGNVLSDGASSLAVDLITETLEKFDPRLLEAKLKERPEIIVDVANALSRIRARDQAGVTLAQKVEEYKRGVQKLKDIVEEKGSATSEDLAGIFKEAYGV